MFVNGEVRVCVVWFPTLLETSMSAAVVYVSGR